MNKLIVYAACSALAATLISPTAAADQAPFRGTVAQIPGTIQAENFDEGGEGVAYHDADAGNNGLTYRAGDVDIDQTGAHSNVIGPGDIYVGWTQAGEWFEYTVNVQASTAYWLEVRLASQGQGGTFHIEVDGTRSEEFQVPDTGGWRNWTVVTSQGLGLTAGLHTMRIALDSIGPSGSVANIDWVRLTPIIQSIPGVIEAERFNVGIDGESYHDSDAANNGGQYRPRGESVDVDHELIPGSFGSVSRDRFYVGWTNAGEWIEYNVNVQTEGYYEVQATVASQGQGGTFHLDFDSIDKTGPTAIPDTGGWRNWAIVARGGIYLTAGGHVMHIRMDSVGPSGSVGNFDSLQFVLQSAVKTPYNGTPQDILGRDVFAVQFDQGGEGVAYHDTDSGNNGGYYRATGVDIDRAANGTYYVGWTQSGEWLEYTINVPNEGQWHWRVTLASQGQGGIFHLAIDGVDKTGPISVPDTGGWRNWRDLTSGESSIFLPAGTHVLRLAMDSAGPSGSVANFNSVFFTPVFRVPTSVWDDTTINAANFDDGGEGVAYHDTDAGNNGGCNRSTDVDVDFDPNGGYCYVGWTRAGEWLEYSVEIKAAGNYLLELSVASDGVGGAFHLEFGGVDKTGPIEIPDTGGWRNWSLVRKLVVLEAPPYPGTIMRIAMDREGPSGSVANIRSVRFIKQ